MKVNKSRLVFRLRIKYGKSGEVLYNGDELTIEKIRSSICPF
jgi:hypothetical protein